MVKDLFAPNTSGTTKELSAEDEGVLLACGVAREVVKRIRAAATPERMTSERQALEQAIANTEREAALKSYYLEKVKADVKKFLPDVSIIPGPLALEGDLTRGAAAVSPRMNFANFEAGTGHDGTQFVVLNGGTPEAQSSIAQWLERQVGFLGKVYFVDADASRASLDKHGGMGCRGKGYGQVVG